MTISRGILSLAAASLFASCASKLDKSRADRILRLEGSYTCERTTLEPAGRRESLAEADATRVRCAQDSWAIFGSEVRYTRSLYQTRECRIPLGKIQYRLPAERLPSGVAVQAPSCESVRTSGGWVGERAGKCYFKDQALHRPYPVRPGCHAYIPKICSDPDLRVELIAAESEMTDDDRHEPVSAITVVEPGRDQKGVCRRYAGE